MEKNDELEIVQKENEINIRYDHLYKSNKIFNYINNIITLNYLKYSNNNR